MFLFFKLIFGEIIKWIFNKIIIIIIIIIKKNDQWAIT